MLKRTVLILICVIQVFSLSSCYDAEEIDDGIHVISIGVDSGVSDKWRLTLQFSKISKNSPNGEEQEDSGDTGSGDQGSYSFVTIDAPSFFGAIDMLNSSIPARINFMHAQILVFSEELAKSGKIGEFIAPIARYKEIRGTIDVMVTTCTAMDFIKNNTPYNGISLSKDLYLLADESKKTGLFPQTNLHRFYVDLKSTYEQPYCALVGINDFSSFDEDGDKWGEEFKPEGNYYAGEIPRKGGNEVEFLGTAFFDGDIMSGKLNGDETRLLLMTTGQFKQAFYTMQDPLKPELIIPLDIRAESPPKVKVKFKDGKPKISVEINLEGNLLTVQSRIKYEEPKKKLLLEKHYADYIKDNLDKLIEKCIDSNVDILHFGRVACKQFLTIKEWEDYHWLKNFKESDVTTKVNFIIRQTGNQLDSSDIEFSGGSE